MEGEAEQWHFKVPMGSTPWLGLEPKVSKSSLGGTHVPDTRGPMPLETKPHLSPFWEPVFFPGQEPLQLQVLAVRLGLSCLLAPGVPEGPMATWPPEKEKGPLDTL